MAGDYPKREPYFAHRFVRMMAKDCTAQTIGPDACWLLTVIAMTEDAKRYRGPVTFYNEQLSPICGFPNPRSLRNARDKAVESGLLHYECGGRGIPGRYWCVMPEWANSTPDNPTDEDIQGNNALDSVQIGVQIPSTSRPSNRPHHALDSALDTCTPSYLSLSPVPCPIPEDIAASAASEVVKVKKQEPLTDIVFPVCGKSPSKEWPLPVSKLAEYRESFPGVNIDQELRKAVQWCRDNPTKRKTAAGIQRFISSWLGRAQNAPRPSAPQPQTAEDLYRRLG
jgi:hypothetical protein